MLYSLLFCHKFFCTRIYYFDNTLLYLNFFICRLLAENEKMRTRNLYLESKSLDHSFKDTVIFPGKGKSNISIIPKRDAILKLSVDDSVTDLQTSVSTDSLDKIIRKEELHNLQNEVETSNEMEKAKKNIPEGLELGNEVEVEVEVDLNVLECGRSARLCAKLKKVAQEKEGLKQVR